MKVNKYSERDLVSIRKNAIESLRNSSSKWTDFNESDLGMILIEAIAGIADYNNFYIDNQALESNLMTARQPKNIKAILESYNFKVKTLGSAVGHVDFYFNQPYHLSIPQFTMLQSVNGIDYVTSESVVVTESMSSVRVPVIQGTRIEEIVDLTKLETSYRYYIKSSKVPIDSVRLFSKSQDWELVDDAFLAVEGGAKYSVHEDHLGQVYILFTFDFKNYIPNDNSNSLILYYVSSLGTKGVVPPMYITRLVSKIFTSEGIDVSSNISVSNSNSTYGAYDSINWSKLKAIGRNKILTMGRYITLNDYKSGIESEPYVIDSYTCDWRTDPDRVGRPYQVKSWILSTDSLSKDSYKSLFSSLASKIMEKGDVAVYVSIYPAQPKEFSLSIDLVIRGDSLFKESVRLKIVEYLKNKYSLYNLKLGDYIDKHMLEIEISKISPSILSVNITNIDNIIRCSEVEFLKLGVISCNLLNLNKIDFGLLDGEVDG